MDEQAKALLARNTNAVIRQSVASERVAAELASLPARLAMQQAALSKVSVAWLVLLVALAASAGGYVGVIGAEQQRERRSALVAAGAR